jgi:hypothetical protein
MTLKNLHRIKAALLVGLVILALVMPTAAQAQGGIYVVQRVIPCTASPCATARVSRPLCRPMA